MRSTLQNIAHIATCVTLALVGAAGCGRDGAPWQVGGDVVARAHNGKAISTTTITAAELGTVQDFGGKRLQTVGEYLKAARGDITNADKRMDILETRLGAAPADVQRRLLPQLRETRGQRDALADDLVQIEGAPRSEWPERRAQLDSDWDALLTRIDGISDAMTASAMTPAPGTVAVYP